MTLTPGLRAALAALCAAAILVLSIVAGQLTGAPGPEEPPTTSPTTATTAAPTATSTTEPATGTTGTSSTSTTTTTTSIPPDDRPGPDSTGPATPATGLRRISSAQLATELAAGDVTGVYVLGQFTAKPAHNGRTLTDFVIDAGGQAYGVRSTDGATGLTFRAGLIRNTASTSIYGGGWSASALEMTASGGDCVKPTSNVVLEGSWCHGIGTAPGAHADFVQFQIAGGSANVRVDRNFCDLGVSTLRGSEQANACVQLNEQVTKLTGVSFTGNWLTGGNYTVNCSGPAAGSLGGRDTVWGGDARYGRNTGCSGFR